MSRLKASSTPDFQKRCGDYRKYRCGGKRSLSLSLIVVVIVVVDNGRKVRLGARERK
jgi:hypothetical protein